MLYPLILGIVYTLGLGFAVFGGMGAEDGGFTTIAGVRASFMAGPFGLLLYVILRKVTGKGGWTLFEARSPASA